MNTKQLRQKILDLAIRGKLVPQDPNDEPASVLLERIRAEKEKLIKAGKIKRDKRDSIIFDGDKSHYGQVPPGWEWCRLGELGEVGSSKRVFTSELVENGVPFYRGTEIGALAENKPIKRSLFISENHYQELISDSGHPSIGDLLMPSICPDGRIWRVDTLEPFYFKDGRVLWIHFDSDEFDKKYIHLALKAMLIKTFSGIASGSTFAELKIFILKDIEIPLAPLAEQRRIVAAIESAFAVIDEIERNKSDLQSTLTAAKSKILSLAIRGKLVPQDLNDEPASVLLERIQAEREKLVKAGKIKRAKGENVIVRGDDNSYYGKLPQGWALARLGEVCEIARGGSPRPIQAFLTDSTDGINWIKIGDTEVGGKYITKTEEKIKPEGIKRSRYVNVGDFLLSNSMSFGRPYILKIDGCIHDGWLVLGKVGKVFNADFLYYALSSPLMYDLLSRLAAGSTVKNLNSDLVKMVIFPIPPLNEQIHIATEIENAMEYFDKISTDLI